MIKTSEGQRVPRKTSGSKKMSLQVIHTPQAPAAIGPYSQAIRSGDFVFVSGQIGLKPETGELVSAEFTEQVRRALDNLFAVLRAAECRPADVVSVDVFLKDMRQFSIFNEIYEEYFSPHKPARAVVEVSGLPRGSLVEIKCVARSGA